ncbi:MAG: SpoIIE family protein phosphatase [Oceanidesulfovibrio sp.]
MTRSLKGKLLALIVAILVATAACVILISMQDVRTSMERAEERSTDNVLELVRHTVETTYRNLLFERVEAVTSRKQRLADAADVAVDAISEFADLAENGILPPQQARRLALDWIADLNLGETAYYLVYDDSLRPLVRNFAPGLGRLAGVEDIKGRPLLAGMFQEVQKYGNAYSVFHAPRTLSDQPARLLGYFAHVPEFDWVLSTGLDIADVQREETRRRETALRILGQSLREIRIADSGFAFIFDGRGRLLVAPPERTAPMDEAVAEIVSPESLASLITAAQNRTNPVTLQVHDAEGDPHAADVRVFRHPPLDWYMAVASFQDEVAAPAQSLAIRQAIIIASVFLVAFIITAIVVDKISDPLKRLAGHAVQIGSEDFTAPEPPAVYELEKLAKNRRDEVGLVALALRTMERSLRENVLGLLQATKERERIDYELHMARTIQMDMLPAAPDAHLDEDGAELHALLIPAREVGGDLFHYERLGPGRILFAVGDVSGKGVPASLFMALTMSLLKSKTHQVADPGRMLLEINDELCRGNNSQMFVTLFVGILDTEDGDLRYASGGHNPPLMLRADGSTQFLTVTEDPMLGILPAASYTTHLHVVPPGGAIIAYTDGVTEAMNPSRALFGERRLELVVRTYANRSAEMLNRILVKAVQIHEGEAEQSDDITLLVLRRRDQADERMAPAEKTGQASPDTAHPAHRDWREAPPILPIDEYAEHEATARDEYLEAFLNHENQTAKYGAPPEEEREVEIVIPDQAPGLALDENALAQGLEDEFDDGYPAVDPTAEGAAFIQKDAEDEPLDLAPEWTVSIPAEDDAHSTLYLGEELEDLESDDDLPLGMPESIFTAEYGGAGRDAGLDIPEPPDLDAFRLTADPEELLEDEDELALLEFDVDEEELGRDLPAPNPAAPDGYSGETPPEGGFEVIPPPPGEMYAQNPEIYDGKLEPYDDPANLVAIHSDVRVHPDYQEEDMEFVLDDEDENGYAEMELSDEGERYEDLYLDDDAIVTIESDDTSKP